MAKSPHICRKCGRGIKPTGRRGRPRVMHPRCQEIVQRKAAREKANRAVKAA